MKFVVLFVLSVVVMLPLRAQDCNQIFKQVIDKVKDDRKVATEKGFAMGLRVRVTMEDGKVHSEEMDISMKGKKYKYATKAMNLYQDEKTSVVVNTLDNSILITKPGTASNVYEQMTKMQDSIASYFDMKSCGKEWGLVDKNTGYYKLTLLPTEKLKGMGINSIVYAVAVDKMEVRRINVYYDPELADGVKDYEMTITSRHEGSIPQPFSGAALDVVMDEGKPKNTYATYSIVDKRN